jgi:MFS family permease
MRDPKAKAGDVQVVVLSQFITAFSWTYVYIFLPFYIQQISPYEREGTLMWTGWILGITGIASTIFAPIWGGMAAKVSPKRLYETGMLVQAGFMVLMGFTRSLPVLLLLRLLIGCVGGLSTIALIIMMSASSTREKITGNVGLFQAALTSGQIAGPIAGAFSAELIGYRGTFLVGGALMLVAFAHVHLRLSRVSRFRPELPQPSHSRRGLAAGWLLCFAASIQIAFLPSVLPEILAGLRIAQTEAVRTAGLIVFAYGVTSVLGSYYLSRLAILHGRHRTLLWVTVGASGLQLLLGATGSVTTFGLVRMLQVGLIAAVIPIVFAEVAASAHGRVIGFMNTSRFASYAAGPLIATAAFAHASPFGLYLGLSLFTLLALILFLGASAGATALVPPP